MGPHGGVPGSQDLGRGSALRPMLGTGHPCFLHEATAPERVTARTDLGRSLQRGDQAAVWNLDVRKVSTAVTSVQDDLGLVLHFQLTLDLLQSPAIQEGYSSL